MSLVGDVTRDIQKHGSTRLCGLSLSASAHLASTLPHPESLVIVTPDRTTAQAFARDLNFFLPKAGALVLPETESIPLEKMFPDIDTASARIRALGVISGSGAPIVIPAPALLQPVPPPSLLGRSNLILRVEMSIDRESFLTKLLSWGYRRVAVVSQVGEIAARGGIIDIFSPAADLPYRLELWGDDIKSIRIFDPDLQRSVDTKEEIHILPATEIIRDNTVLAEGTARLRRCLSSLKIGFRERENILSLWEDGRSFAGISLFMPAIYECLATVLDYLAEGSLLVLFEPEQIASSLRDFIKLAQARATEDLPPPEKIYADPEVVLKDLVGRRNIKTGDFGSPDAREIASGRTLSFPERSSRTDRMSELVRLIEANKWPRLRIAARNETTAERISGLLSGLGHEVPRISPDKMITSDLHAGITIGHLSAGFYLQDEGLAFVSDSDLFGPAREMRVGRKTPPEWDLPIGSLTAGDIVVHIEHGIARYEGLKQLEVADHLGEFLHLVFSGGDTLYVPVQDMNRVQRYRSSSEPSTHLSKLGTAAWGRAKERVRRSLKNMAAELIRLSAVRKSKPGHSFGEPDFIFREFEASFPWTETPDQEKTIKEVLEDMMSPDPMDRLVCGDVGYGKTEVALRASFMAALDGKQTALLVPTTVLAQQHYQNFTERLEGFPVSIAMLSRFVSPAEVKAVLAELAAGTVDIVVGTHRLLSGDVKFADLGLLVIDEEHRFGVRHKEKLKKLKETVDILTLSATPIPRTLYQSFSGLRDLSLMHTPPAGRKAVHTEIRYFDEHLIRDAVEREMDRGGQTYIVHNRVLSIHAFAEMVRKLVPQARVGVAHGQMGEKQLEKIMVTFLKGDYDVLVTTAIIESGLDIPNSNTLIINRADRFGLAQLYQLRGRVGRSSVLAYSYLLIPPTGALTRRAKERLSVLKDLTELGSGFKLASYDMEIRGAGNLLGEEQSGHIAAVGLDLFSQLLEQAVRDASGESPPPDVEPILSLGIPAILPEDYLPDVGERLTLYKRLAQSISDQELESLREETLDRFGKFTPEIRALFTQMEITILARNLSAEKVDLVYPYFIMVLHPQARVSPDALVNMLTKDRRVHFIPPTTIRLDISEMNTVDDRITYLKEILRSLS
ncbi:MAG: transcription-repair coupling factor [bacterium]